MTNEELIIKLVKDLYDLDEKLTKAKQDYDIMFEAYLRKSNERDNDIRRTDNDRS